MAKLYGPLLGRDLKPLTEIIPSVGAYGSLFTSMHALINAGDEVIIIEPFFDCYTYMVKSAQGVPRYVPLKQVTAGPVRIGRFSGKMVGDAQKRKPGGNHAAH